MYRRLEVIHPELRYYYHGDWHKEPAAKLGILGAADFSWTETLRGPDRDIPSNTRFFFTEKGWKEVGRHVVAECKRQGQEVRVISVKEASVNVVWGDEYEIAAQPKTPRSKKRKWFY
jgi:hypothetical protein